MKIAIGSLLVALFIGFLATGRFGRVCDNPTLESRMQRLLMLALGRTLNPGNASASLKTVSVAESDFRGNDSSRVEDFWTLDIRGLYTVKEPPLSPEETPD